LSLESYPETILDLELAQLSLQWKTMMMSRLFPKFSPKLSPLNALSLSHVSLACLWFVLGWCVLKRTLIRKVTVA
jgi:hypothetical protein